MNSSPTPKVAVIIVNYQAGDIILQYIDKLRAELRPYEGSTIYIVDNASPNGDLAKLTSALGNANDIELIDGGSNLGFAKANNIAYARSIEKNTDYAFFINPDAYPETGALGELISCMEITPKAAIVGAQLLNEASENSACNFRFPNLQREFASEFGLTFLKKLFDTAPDHRVVKTVPEKTEWVSGAAFLMRCAASTDLMDGTYFLYYEETDMMRRLTKEGWEIWHCPNAKVIHVGGVSTGVEHGTAATKRLPDYWFQSWRYYYVKNHGRFYALAAGLAKTLGIFASYPKHALKGETPEHPPHYLSDVIKHCVWGVLTGK